jgi:hypothetical protein
MNNVDFYFWINPQKPPKKPTRTRWRMTLEDGRRQFPDGYPDLTSKETRSLPENPYEAGQSVHRIEVHPPGSTLINGPISATSPPNSNEE